MNDNGDVSTYTPNALNQYENVGGGAVSYDGNFNLTGLGGFWAIYNAANQLVSAQSGEDTAQFVYDGLGRCLKRTVSWETTLIVYDGWKPIVEWSELGSRDIDRRAERPSERARTSQWNVWEGEAYFKAWNVYGPGADEILWRYADSSGHLRYHSDRHGNIIALLDAQGNGIEKYTYDVFGKPTVTDWSGGNVRYGSWYGNRFLFQGREYFPDLGLYDYRNRFYHPILGRFLQTDPTGFDAGDMNLFRYCGDDPVNRSDPLGLDWAVIDAETQSWALRASAQNLAARQAEGWSLRRIFINMTAHSEFGTTVYKGNGNVGMSNVYTDGNRSTVRGRDYSGKTSLVYTHTHNHDRISKVTKSHLSVPDVRVANNRGVTVQVTTPSGAVDRVRPSTATTRDGRWEEGATIERLNSGTEHFETLKGANADVPRHGPVGEGMASPSAQEGRRTFDAYGSTTAHAADWEATYGPGGWLATQRNTGF